MNNWVQDDLEVEICEDEWSWVIEEALKDHTEGIQKSVFMESIGEKIHHILIKTKLQAEQ